MIAYTITRDAIENGRHPAAAGHTGWQDGCHGETQARDAEFTVGTEPDHPQDQGHLAGLPAPPSGAA
ncbi:hypothetical protein ABIE67_000444 [Streptomyces sp. V4I8]|uniref:hypothetical protein n=1 Tax=Streptomyces sp. V4I8 TaxID=3156469 RepID=UPI0035187743